MRHPRNPVAVYGTLIALGVLFGTVTFATCHAETNLPVICLQADVAGKPLSACPSTSQVFDKAAQTSLVRACANSSCLYSNSTWKTFSTVPGASYVEVCGSEKSPGAAVVDCPGTDGAQWSGMKGLVASSVPTTGTPEPPDPSFPGTFTVNPACGASPLNVTLAWDVTLPTGSKCRASGSPEWSGDKPLKGTQTLTQTVTTSYVLTCGQQSSATGSAPLQWTNPTQNTDGTALTDQAGTRILYGTDVNTLTQTVTVPDPAATTYTVSGLAAGPWYFSARSYNAAGAESVNSNTINRTISTTSQSHSDTQTVTILTVPQAPVMHPGPATRSLRHQGEITP